MQTATDDRLVGRLLEGRYRLTRLLAHGGMSSVYSAVDERLEREVAVKVMAPLLSADRTFADRFTQEARVAARLSHANAVSVYDQGTDGEHIFLVMELVRGRTLRDLLRQYGALSPALAVSIMQPVLGALAAAHRAGLVHRDVKPENILLADDGAVKVADFGLARAIESDLSSTRTGLMMGTVAYCPPEQLTRGKADARSDVYSAGIVLFELLTGSVPYAGDTPMAVAYQHVNSDVPRPSSRRPEVAWQLDDVVQRATNREPVARQLDAGAFLAELHDVRADLGLPIVAVPPRPELRRAPDATQPIPRQAAAPAGAARSKPANRTGEQTQVLRPAQQNRPDQQGVQHTLIADMRAGVPSGAGSPAPTVPPRSDRPAGRRRHARRRAIIIGLVILLLGLATGTGAWWFVAGRYDQVPNVDGLSRGSAIAALQRAGFKVAPDPSALFSETVKADSVISTSPGQSSRVVHGRTISLTVSKGLERFTVPDLSKAQSYAAATQALASIPVQPVPSQTTSDTVAAGAVVKTTPPAGTPVKRGSVVEVFISTGLPNVSVPDVGGQDKAKALATLSAANFKPTPTEEFSDTIAAGVVIRTDPAAGSTVQKFSPVTVIVSKGSEMVTIPDIPNGSIAEAVATQLNNIGLDAKIIQKKKSLFDFSSYQHQIYDVEPAPGTSVKIGTEVDLYAK